MLNNPYPSSPITDTASVILYSPQPSADDLICPLSPTSSLRGIYVCSRPTSMEVLDECLGFDFGGFYQAPFNINGTVEQGDQSADFPLHAHSLSSSTLSNDNEFILTPTTSEYSRVSSGATSIYTDEEYTQKNATRRTAETRAHVKALSEDHAFARKHYPESISPSVTTTASKNTVTTLGLGRHFNKGGREAAFQDIEEGDNLAAKPSAPELIKDQTPAQKKRSIPLVYRAITKKVYGVFHRKTYSTPESIQLDSHLSDSSVNDASAALIQESKPVEAIKSSPLSLFAMKRRPMIDSQKDPPRSKNVFSHRALSSHPASPNNVTFTSTSLLVKNRARLRRSLSFAGFVDLPELDDELDEATTEATQIATRASVMARWANVQGRQGYESDGLDDS